MYFTISQTTAFEMGHWMALSIFILTISSGELKADSLAGKEKLRDTGAVFSEGKIKNQQITFDMNSTHRSVKTKYITNY